MKYSILFSVLLFTLFTGASLVARPVLAQATGGGACPAGFYPALPNVCVATNLSGSTVIPLSASGDCPVKYEHTPGTQFCSLPEVSLDWDDGRYLIDGPIAAQCPENFGRVAGSGICIANHLALALQDNTLTLLAPTLACPQGFEQLPAATSCTAIAGSSGQPTDPTIVMPDCAPGFIKPPHVHFCIAYEVARKTSERVNFGIAPPAGECPKFWTKNAIGGFCVPQSSAVSCGPGSFPCAHQPGDKVAIVDDSDCCPDGGPVVIGHIPAFNNEGPLELTTKPVVMCLPPGEGEHLDCVGLPYFDLTN